ncbi:MAG: FimB/Mfa2 family fimbrial subunit [Alistipes sp.]|nr:FimB/Mfa2 family fimbrial subunit [Alistipes sp.]
MKLYTARILPMLLTLAVTLSSCLKENEDDCVEDASVALRFTFTHHDETEEPTDLFPYRVNDVDVYIFDENDRYVYNMSVAQNSLSGGNTLYLDLEEGEYKIVTWGNLSDSGYGVDAPEQTRNGFTVSATTDRPDISDLFHGTATLTVDGSPRTQEIQLIRNTHVLRVHLIGLSEPTRTIPGTDYSIRVEGSNHHYDFDNNPVAQSAATYIPTYTSLTYGEKYAVRADFKVQRLLRDQYMTLTISNGNGTTRTDDIIQRILTVYDDIETTEDLDRRYEYDLYYELDDDTGTWVFIGNSVSDWDGPSMPGDL